jgi:hypothetical protein
MKTALIAAAAVLAAGALPAAAAPDTAKAYHLMVPNLRVPHSDAAKTMLYFAGPVISNVKVVAVMWSSGVNSVTQQQMPPFYTAIVNSTFLEQLKQYRTNRTGVNGMPGTNQKIKKGSFLGEVVITPVNNSKTLTDAQVQTELEGQISAGNLPAADLNTLYMIHFPSDITITLDGSTSCVDFGAYHEATSSSVTPNNIFYGVMPDCGGGIVDQTYVSSHEFAEAVTDPIPTPGSNPAYPQAWNDKNGYEIGDLCEGDSAVLTAKKSSWTVTQVFLNSINSCSTGNYTTPY